MNQRLRWEYDPGNKRFDHKWSRDQAGFRWSGKRLKGQCPASITRTEGLAEKLLNDGVPDPADTDSPDAFYNVYKGVVYRAEPTLHGVSYHGFPEKEEGKRRVPDSVLFELARRAKINGDFFQFKQWMQEHLPNGWKRVGPHLCSRLR
ncbi:MAG: hypothetical protein HQL82_06525 [Magnetococcales bacterium]|nr:hypothetical protein [Magnetococcales bacterium]